MSSSSVFKVMGPYQRWIAKDLNAQIKILISAAGHWGTERSYSNNFVPSNRVYKKIFYSESGLVVPGAADAEYKYKRLNQVQSLSKSFRARSSCNRIAGRFILTRQLIGHIVGSGCQRAGKRNQTKVGSYELGLKWMFYNHQWNNVSYWSWFQSCECQHASPAPLTTLCSGINQLFQHPKVCHPS